MYIIFKHFNELGSRIRCKVHFLRAQHIFSPSAPPPPTQTYGGFAYMFADLQQCTTADVFVGTFSSNMGRLLVLLRESISLKARHSAISLDGPWWAGRQRQRRLLAA